MQSYNKIKTKHEEQLQFLLQVLFGHRSAYPEASLITRTQRNEQ